MVFYLVLQALDFMFKGDKDEDLSVEELEELAEKGKVLEKTVDPEDIDVI